jgi:hypothetical protein
MCVCPTVPFNVISVTFASAHVRIAYSKRRVRTPCRMYEDENREACDANDV